MVWPIRAWLGLIQYEKALLWLWGHCPSYLLVGGEASAPSALPGSYTYAKVKSKLATVSLHAQVSIAVFCVSFYQRKQPVCNDIQTLMRPSTCITF